MGRKTDLIVANPAGNITIMVLTPVPREEYQETANRLLEIDFGAYCSWADSVMGEQVAYILPECKSYNGTEYPAMEMCGLEFCGNASRSFAYYRKLMYDRNSQSIDILVSGCDHPLTATVDTAAHNVQIQMPLPAEISDMDGNTFVDLGGISHLFVQNPEASIEAFSKFRQQAYSRKPDMEAFGVMFMDTETDTMTPVVYVRDVDTTYFEGSCASGTTAASCARALAEPEASGTFTYTFKQPEGTLYASVTKSDGRITDIQLSGNVELSDIITVEI